MNHCIECGQPTDEPGGLCEACQEEIDEANAELENAERDSAENEDEC